MYPSKGATSDECGATLVKAPWRVPSSTDQPAEGEMDHATPSPAYNRFAGTCAVIAGVAGFAYAVAFIGLVLTGAAPELGVGIASALLLIGSLLTAAALSALYPHLRAVDPGFALLALILGIGGSIGAAVHGGFDLANVLHAPSPAGSDALAGLPNYVDPRGLLTFGATGLGLIVASWLILRGGAFPTRLGQLGYLAGALLLVIYLGRLIILTPTNPLVAVPAALSGFIVNPAWFIWLGLILRKR